VIDEVGPYSEIGAEIDLPHMGSQFARFFCKEGSNQLPLSRRVVVVVFLLPDSASDSYPRLKAGLGSVASRV